MAEMSTYDCTCPWCHNYIDDLWDLFVPDHADAVETECPVCGKLIKVRAETEYNISKVRSR